jgi:hypothetical protein
MNQRGFSQIILLGIITILILAGASGFLLLPEKKIPSSENEKAARQEVSPPALGSLCSGKDECINFCLNNRGKCEGYCKGRGVELCKIIFPPGEEYKKQPTAVRAVENKPVSPQNKRKLRA